MLAAHIKGKPIPETLDLEALELFEYGVKAWAELSHLESLPLAPIPPQCTHNLWTLSGTIDLFSVGRPLDWKSGWKMSDYYHPQMWGYSDLVRALEAVIVWLRYHCYEIVPALPHDEFVERVTEKVKQIGLAWNPGEHCAWCPRRLACGPYAEYRRSCVAPFAITPRRDVPIPAERMADLSIKADVVKRGLDAFKAVQREWIDEHGPLPLGNGTQLAFQKRSTETIKPEEAWGRIVDELGVGPLGTIVKIGKGALEKAIKAKAPKGQKQKVWQEFQNELREIDATEITVSRQLRKVKCDD